MIPEIRWSVIAAGDIDTAARLVEKLRGADFTGKAGSPPWNGGSGVEDRGGIEGHPMAAVLAALFYAMTGRPAEADAGPENMVESLAVRGCDATR